MQHLNLPYTTRQIYEFASLTKLNTLVFSRVAPIRFSNIPQYVFYQGKTPEIYVPKGYSKIYYDWQKEGLSKPGNEYNYLEANVSLMFNYQDSPNDDFYFIDYKVSGSTIYQPDNPTREGYVFEGWYSDPSCTSLWDFGSIIDSELTLYASWKAI